MPAAESLQSRADKLKTYWSDRDRKAIALSQDIGDIPKPKSTDRRDQAIEEFSFFCFQYFPRICIKPWAEHHHIVSRKMLQCIDHGGLFAFALPRGSLKTTLCRFMTLWLALTGRSKYTIFLGASERAAEKRLHGIKTILSTNRLLLEDFPEVCYPIDCMDRSTRRCVGQKTNGRHTAMEWLARHIVLPTIEGSAASGARIECYGITGEIRGADHVLESGDVVRPKVVFADDPQTRESAKSPSQSEHRERVLVSDVAYLNGPNDPISVLAPCTKICENDLACRMLDRERNPQWRGECHRMMDSMPSKSAMKLWEQYENLVIDSHNADEDMSGPTDFYQKNRRAMDDGASATWEHRHNKDELSAVQHAMNLYFRDRRAFMAEMQNDPLDDDDALAMRSADEIEQHFSGYSRYEFPKTCQHLTAFVDIQGKLLYYLVAAWDMDFTGYVIDYGTFPKQRKRYFTLADARTTLASKFPRKDQSGRIYAGLEEVGDMLLGRTWQREDGTEMHISRMLVDNGWNESANSVHLFSQTSPHANVIMPSHGRGIKASHLPMHEWQAFKKMRNPLADGWVVHVPEKSKKVLTVTYDVNLWKTRVHQGLSMAKGDRGCIALWSHSRNQAGLHRMIADQLTSERPVKTEAAGRVVYEWHLRPGRDNHLFDCLVGAAAAASMCGVQHAHAAKQKQVKKKRSRKRVTYTQP